VNLLGVAVELLSGAEALRAVGPVALELPVGEVCGPDVLEGVSNVVKPLLFLAAAGMRTLEARVGVEVLVNEPAQLLKFMPHPRGHPGWKGFPHVKGVDGESRVTVALHVRLDPDAEELFGFEPVDHLQGGEASKLLDRGSRGFF